MSTWLELDNYLHLIVNILNQKLKSLIGRLQSKYPMEALLLIQNRIAIILGMVVSNFEEADPVFY